MSKKKTERGANVEQPKGVRVKGTQPRQTKTVGVKITSTTNTANPDMKRGVEIQGGRR